MHKKQTHERQPELHLDGRGYGGLPAHTRRPALRQQEQQVSAPLQKKEKDPKGLWRPVAAVAGGLNCPRFPCGPPEAALGSRFLDEPLRTLDWHGALSSNRGRY